MRTAGQLNPHDDKASTYVSRPKDLCRVTTFHVGTFIIEYLVQEYHVSERCFNSICIRIIHSCRIG